MDLGADNQHRRNSAQLLGTRPPVAFDAGAPASEAAYSRTQLTPPIREYRGSPSENRGVRGAQDDKSGSWNHHYHHRPHHHYSDQGRVSPYSFNARPHTSDSRDDPRQQTPQTTAWPYERLDRLDIRNPDHHTGLRTSHLALYADQVPVSQEIGRGNAATGRVSPVVDIPESGLARNTRRAPEGRGTGQDQSMSASRAQIRQSLDACPPSISAHHVNPFPANHRTSHQVRNIRPSRNGHELVQDEHPFERQPRRAEYPPHSPHLFIHTAQRGQAQEYLDRDRRSPQISPMEYEYRRTTQASLSPQALIPPLQPLLRAPSNAAGRDGGNRMKLAGRQYSPSPSGHYTRDQHYKLDSRGSSQLRHHPYQYSPPQPTRRHSESLSPQGQWTHSPREHQYPQQHQQQQDQHQHQYQQRQERQQQPQQQQQIQQQTHLHQVQLSPNQTSSREHLVSQNRRKENVELGRQHGKGNEGKEMRPKNYEQLSATNETKSGTNNDRGQPRLQPFNMHPLRATGSPVSPGQAHEENPAQARPPIKMTPALSFSNISSNVATSRVDQRGLIPQHQYRALRLSHRQQQDRPSHESTAIVSRPPHSPHGGALTLMSLAEYDRQGPKPETRISATPQHGKRRVSFIEDSLDEIARPHMITRGSSLEARWEPRPRTSGSSASNQEVQDGDESPDPALPRRHSVADALELRSQDRRGGVVFEQERFQDMRSKSLVAAPGEVCSAHYVATPSRPEQQEWPSRNLRDEHFGRPHHQQQQQQQQQEHPMFVEVRGRDSTPGSSTESGGPLSSTLASPTERSSQKDVSSNTTRLAENGHSIQKQEPMEIELPPGSIAVAAAAADTITGINKAEYRSNYLELESLPSPLPQNAQSDLGQPGYYTEQKIQKLYCQWRTREEEEKRSNQQSQQSDRDDVSMVGSDEGDAHDGGGPSDVWAKSQHVDRHLRNEPELRHSSQEGEDGDRSPNKGKSRKVEDAEDAGRRDDAGERRRKVSQDPENEEWEIEDEENEDDDNDEDDGEGEDDGEEGDDGYCQSEDGDEPKADDWDGKNAVARRTRTQTGRKDQLRRRAKNSTSALSRAGTSAPGESPRRARAKDDKKHECEECQKRFSRPSQLRTHQLTHSGEKPHQCHLCDKNFNVASNLKRHIRTHDKIPRKNSRDGSGVFRGFTQGFQAKHNPNLKANSPGGSRKARSSKTNLSSSVIIPRRSTGTTQTPERLRWMSTETPESSMMAASKQAKIAANKQRSAEEGASSSAKPGSTTSPSEITPTNAQPAAAVGVETGSSAPGYHPPQPLPPPTPQPSRESDSESTLVEGTQVSDGDDDMGEPGLDNSDINNHRG